MATLAPASLARDAGLHLHRLDVATSPRADRRPPTDSDHTGQTPRTRGPHGRLGDERHGAPARPVSIPSARSPRADGDSWLEMASRPISRVTPARSSTSCSRSGPAVEEALEDSTEVPKLSRCARTPRRAAKSSRWRVRVGRRGPAVLDAQSGTPCRRAALQPLAPERLRPPTRRRRARRAVKRYRVRTSNPGVGSNSPGRRPCEPCAAPGRRRLRRRVTLTSRPSIRRPGVEVSIFSKTLPRTERDRARQVDSCRRGFRGDRPPGREASGSTAVDLAPPPVGLQSADRLHGSARCRSVWSGAATSATAAARGGADRATGRPPRPPPGRSRQQVASCHRGVWCAVHRSGTAPQRRSQGAAPVAQQPGMSYGST